MRIITYLGFTLLSILIQFSVMDYIQERTFNDGKNLNGSSQSSFNYFDSVSDQTRKNLALFYQVDIDDLTTEVTPKLLINMSTTEKHFTPMSTSTSFEEIYDENDSTTAESFTSSYTSTEIDNVTDITFFEKKNESAGSPIIPKKVKKIKDCICDLMHLVCDINCCCDSDCTEIDKEMFGCSKHSVMNKECICHSVPFESSRTHLMEYLFCVIEVNLPHKQNLNRKKYDIGAVHQSYKWHVSDSQLSTEFQKKKYRLGDPIWVLKEQSIWYIDTPIPTVNSYCSGRKPILFLKEETIKCIVSIKDLEMLQIINTSQESSCISVIESSQNSKELNCSTLHCANWTLLFCNDIGDNCELYNKTIHEPNCTENYCTNLAVKLDYIFNYLDSKITNATIKFYVKKKSALISFLTQEINIRFLLTNKSIDNIITVSGNPGYINGLPLISSNADSDHSSYFFNDTIKSGKYLTIPGNKEGVCVTYDKFKEPILFGVNKRIKCRFNYDNDSSFQNSTNHCKNIENNVKVILGLKDMQRFVSPFGNPADILDHEWVPVENNILQKENTFGHLVSQNTKLRCFNLITRVSYIFTYINVAEKPHIRENKIVAVSSNVTVQNVTFNIEDISAVLTVDINFIDGTMAKAYEYASGPYLSIHLPKDFFFPFMSNCVVINYNLPLIILCNLIYFKISFDGYQ